jgi:hypothetical protein
MLVIDEKAKYRGSLKRNEIGAKKRSTRTTTILTTCTYLRAELNGGASYNGEAFWELLSSRHQARCRRLPEGLLA